MSDSFGEPSNSQQPAFQLRDYQKKGIEKCIDAFKAGVNRIGVSAPTGSGKTAMFAFLINQIMEQSGKSSMRGSRVLIVVPSTLVAEQIKTYLKIHCGHLGQIGMEQGGTRSCYVDKMSVPHPYLYKSAWILTRQCSCDMADPH